VSLGEISAPASEIQGENIVYMISVQSNAYTRCGYTLDYTLKSLHKLGYDGVEVDCAHMKSTRLWDLSVSQRRTLRKSIEDLGIELEALSCHNHILGPGASFTSSDPKAKQINMDFNKHVMDMAAEFGSQVVTTHVPSPSIRSVEILPGMPAEWYTRGEEHPSRRDSTPYTDEERKLIVQGLGECADYAKDRGVVFAIEVYDPWDFWRAVFGSVASPALKLNLHISQVWRVMLRERGIVEEPSLPDTVREMGSLLAHTHLMDYRARAEIPPSGFPGSPRQDRYMPATVEVIPGAGQCDWISFLKALKEIGYTGYLTIETHRMDIAPEIELAWALRNMKELLVRAGLKKE
jgi:L-ribulose-5-phosphate 3-epimerase